MKKYILHVCSALFLTLVNLSTNTAHAQSGGTPAGGTSGGTGVGQTSGGTVGGREPGLTNPLRVDSLEGFLGAILDGVIQIGTIILIMMLVYVGFLFVVARGNAEKLQTAKSALVWTVIGGLILLGAKSIQLVITGTVQGITI